MFMNQMRLLLMCRAFSRFCPKIGFRHFRVNAHQSPDEMSNVHAVTTP
jgi:hypothetical protein